MLWILELVTLALIMTFAVTQMILPALSGGKLFPSFRKTGKLEAELASVTQEVKDAKLETVIAEVRKEAEAKNKVDKT